MAVAFEHYGQTVAPAAPPQQARAPQPQSAAPRVMTVTRSSTRALRAFVGLAILSAALFLAALIIAVTPLGAIDADITVPFVAVLVGGLGAIVWAALR